MKPTVCSKPLVVRTSTHSRKRIKHSLPIKPENCIPLVIDASDNSNQEATNRRRDPDNSDSDTPPSTTGPLWYQQAFNPQWLEDSQLKDWLQPDPGDRYIAWCSMCDCKLRNSNKALLLKHSLTSKHTQNYAAKKVTNVIQHVEEVPEDDSTDKVAEAGLPSSEIVVELQWEPGSKNILIPSSKKAQKRPQKFRANWMSVSELKDWLQPDPENEYRAICSVCNCTFKTCTRIAFVHHSNSTKHIRNMSEKKSDTKIQRSKKVPESDPQDVGSKAETCSSPCTEDLESTNSDCSDSCALPRKLWYQQAFKAEWMADPQLKDWLQPDPDNKYAAWCIVCDCKLRNCTKSGLKHHATTTKHLNNLATKKGAVSIEGVKRLTKQDQSTLAEFLAVSEQIDQDCSDDCGVSHSSSPPRRKSKVEHENSDDSHVAYSSTPPRRKIKVEHDNSDDCHVTYSSTSPRKKRKVWYQQAFKKEWMADPELKDWLRPDPNNKYGAICSICDSKLKSCNKSTLMVHRCTLKHVNYETEKIMTKFEHLDTPQDVAVEKSPVRNHPKRSPGHYSQGDVFSCATAKSNVSSQHSQKFLGKDIQEKVSKAEQLLSGFMAKHGMPFSLADHLVETLTQMFPDSEIAQNMTMRTAEGLSLMQDGIALEERKMVARICRENKFSLIIDESTSYSVYQILAVMVRFFDEKRCKVTDALLDIVEVDDGSAAGLYKAVKELLENNDIPLNNIIGFACDNCSTMLGANSDFQARLKRDVPHVFILGCVCHSFSLCTSHASTHLPAWLETFLKDACCYLACGGKFKFIWDLVQTTKPRMLKLTQTRWLSRVKVISKILENWDALQQFFQESAVDGNDAVTQLYEAMTSRGTRHMLLFLQYILEKVDKMNLEFQSKYFKLSNLFSSISDEYRSILGMFVHDEVIQSQDLAAIDPQDTDVRKSFNDISLGVKCEAHLVAEPLGEMEDEFRLICQAFLVDLCMQIRQRFPFEQGSVLAMLSILDPREALSNQRNMKSIIHLAVQFPTLVQEEDLDKLHDQWRYLFYSKATLGDMSESATTFWYELRTVRDSNNHVKFDVLSDFMCSLLTLPHSSAYAERVFSQINVVKSRHTDKVRVSAVANHILAKQAIARQAGPFHEWELTLPLIKDINCEQCCQKRDTIPKKRDQASLHPCTSEAASDAEDDTPQVFLL